MFKKRPRVKDELLDHDFDGIQELDNDLPPWWLYLFYLTIIWGVIYMIYYHVLGTGDSSIEAYHKEMAAAELRLEQKKAGVPGSGGASGQTSQTLAALTDEESLEEGQKIFKKNCAVCHGQHGEGIVGPNLTDHYWIHGARMSDIVKTITNGVPQKGMVPWGPVLKKEEILQVASYIISLRGSNPPNPKAPEGEEVDYNQLD